MQRKHLIKQITQISSKNFDTLALDVFRYQAAKNILYQKYINLLNIQIADVQNISNIPFLPIQFFKTYNIKSGRWKAQQIFSSSGTTGQITSRHAIRNLNFYLKNTSKGFSFFYKNLENRCVLALLPSYLEREGSSLVAMAAYFIRLSKHQDSDFFLYNTNALVDILKKCVHQNTPILLIGVSFALLDLAEAYELDLSNADIIVMETGGMKGRRKEITRDELHDKIKKSFNIQNVHSEYGMTELLSQAYSSGDGIFYPCPTLKVLTREITDPLKIQDLGKTGGINLIDLANIDSCCFLASDDIGKVHANGSFEILGRLDTSDIRGCNLMVE